MKIREQTKDTITFELNEDKCPKCGYIMDSATNFESSKGPSEGDISICLKCLQLLQFDSNLKLIIFTEEEFIELSYEERKLINIMLKSLKEIKSK